VERLYNTIATTSFNKMYHLQPEHIHQAQHSNPLKPRNQLFTCLACQVAFPTTDRQRAHYRSE
jgi:hypothetical protein